MKESNIMKMIMVAISEAGHTAFRNNVGAYKNEEGRYIRFGVGGKGGSDIIGITSDGIFFAIEVKTPKGRASKEQETFLSHVRERGGIAGIARSPKDALDLLSR